MEFENACSEMYYILEHMNPIDKKYIPEIVIQFFRDNRSIFYKVNLDVTKRLEEQELKDETKAFILILKEKYFLNKEYQKEEYQEKSMALITIKKENIVVSLLKKILRIFKH